MQQSNLKSRICPNHDCQQSSVILYCLNEFCNENRLICDQCLVKHTGHANQQLGAEKFEKKIQNTQQDNKELLKSLEKVINQFKKELNKFWNDIYEKFDFSINSINQMGDNQLQQCIEQMINSKEEYKKISQSAQEYCDNFIKKINQTVEGMKLSQFNKSVIGDAKHSFNKGYEYYMKKDFEKAISLFDQVLKEDGEDLNALFFKSESLRWLGKRKEAMHFIEQVLAKDPNFVQALYAKGDNLRMVDQKEEALKYFNRVIDLNPKFERALYLKGLLLNQLEKYQESIEILDQVIKNDPQDKKALYLQGDNLSSLNQFQKAIKYLDQVLSIDKDDTNSLGSKGHCLTELGRYDEAEECLNLAVILKPDDQWNIDQLERVKRKRKE